MERRVAPVAALVVVLTLAGVAFGATGHPAPQALEAVTWPASTLLVSEVQTGGATASDEFAEITNVGEASVDLAGFELAYVTATGSTVTRKAAWSTTLLLDPGSHLLIANAAGAYAPLADATYTGGFAATGGAVVLRAIAGAPVDAVGWGDATSSFVEGSPVGAPAAGSSIERKPGGLEGNTLDTNVNATDWFQQATPNPQSLAAPPVPAPIPTATPEPTASPVATPALSLQPSASPTTAPTSSAEPSASVAPTSIPTTSPTVEPTATPSPTIAPTPDPTPTVVPTDVPTAAPTAPPDPSSEPTAALTPAPSAVATVTPLPVISIEAARGLPDGATARIQGVLSNQLGALEAGRKAFVQDDTGGIALYLDVAVTGGLPADTLVLVQGTLDERFGERTLRVAVSEVISLGEQQRPPPWELPTGEIGEANEGWRAIIQGVTVGSPSELADGLGLLVNDGSGEVRLIVGPSALAGAAVPSGTHVIAVGPVGQRDSSGTGLSGYRVHATEQSDFGILPPPTPSPTVTPSAAPTAAPTSTPAPPATPNATATPKPTPVPTPTPAPTATPTPSPTPTATPSPSPTRTPGPTPNPAPTAPPTLTIVEARGAPVGTVISVAGVVTAEAGRLGLPPVIAIADGTSGSRSGCRAARPSAAGAPPWSSGGRSRTPTASSSYDRRPRASR